ncbi:MAG TPA: hypothetical protein VJR89_13860 [Polyangiales bacterium]|nr:hypothetical protein [Polyangiales bacterium]
MKQYALILGALALLGCGSEGTPAAFAAAGGSAPPPAAAGSGMQPAAGGGVPAAGSGTMSGTVSAAGTTAAPAAGAPAAGAPAGGAAGMAAAPAFTPGSPTWSAVFQEIIVGTGCNGGPTCHASTVAGMLKMTNKADSYTALVGAKGMGRNLTGMGMNCSDTGLTRVVPMDPANSLFLQKVEAATPVCGVRMPIGGTLKPEQIEQIRTWIANGAKDD